MDKSIHNLSSVTQVGLDLAKNVFRFTASMRRARRSSHFPDYSSAEACSSAHHWARQLIALGHRVKLIPPAYAKPFVRRSKNDAVDAAAICEALGRPNMRFVPVRSVENQAQLMRHRARELLTENRTRMLNALQGHLAEIGVIKAQGAQNAYLLKKIVAECCDENGEVLVADCVRKALTPLVNQIDAIDAEVCRQVCLPKGAYHPERQLTQRPCCRLSVLIFPEAS